MSNKILILLLIAYLFVLSEAIKRKYYKGVTDRGCGLAMGSKCQHKHIFACHQSNCTMNFYRRNATQGEIPWAVLVVDYDVGSTCTGSILNAKWVLTAAHCVKKANPKKVIVFLGTSPQSFNDTFYLVKQIKVHPRFEYYSILGDSYDIALLELKIPIVFGPDVCSVCLPPPMFEHGEKETALFAGYGTYDVRMMLQTGWVSFNGSLIYNHPSDIMQKPYMRVFAWIYRLFSLRYFFGQLQRTGMFICLWRTPPESGYIICQGDSGGPLVQFDKEGRAVQIGIAHAFDQNVCDPCTRGVPKQKDIEQFNMVMYFIRVAFYVEWIEEQITGRKKAKKNEL